jgi:hypothetical protein
LPGRGIWKPPLQTALTGQEAVTVVSVPEEEEEEAEDDDDDFDDGLGTTTKYPAAATSHLAFPIPFVL